MKSPLLIVAGEASGDNLGAAVIKSLKKKDKTRYSFAGCGGINMKKTGVNILFDIDTMATIGFLEALQNYKKLKKIAHALVKYCLEKNIKNVILIDFPGFNLHLAKLLSKKNINSYLIVSPQIWAWHYSRIKTIKENIKAVLCLYPFELEIYQKESIQATYIGHPVLDLINHSKVSLKSKVQSLKNKFKSKKIIALLPGSRISEIKKHLSFMLNVAAKYHQHNQNTIFLLPTPTETIYNMVKEFDLPEYIHIIKEGSHLVLQSAEAAIACSGTITLECALFNLPHLIIYKTSWLTYWIGKLIVNLKYIGIVNIILKKLVTKEFIQFDMKLEPVYEELNKIMKDQKYKKIILSEFKKLQNVMGKPGAAENAASYLLTNLNSNN